MGMGNIEILGLCGIARCGKDSFADFLVQNYPDTFKKASFAYEIKKDLDLFLTEKLGISAFTEDAKEKEIIRPMLIAWGTDVIRNNYDKNHWIKKINEKIIENSKKKYITIIPDVRFRNELEWVNRKGKSIYIERENCKPKGHIELETLKLKNDNNFTLKWPKMKCFKTEGKNITKVFFDSLSILC